MCAAKLSNLLYPLRDFLAPVRAVALPGTSSPARTPARRSKA